MTTCHFCGETGSRYLNAPHWTGTEYIRVDVCGQPTPTGYTGCRDLIARAPRKPRTPRPAAVLAGEWAMVGALVTGKTFDQLINGDRS